MLTTLTIRALKPQDKPYEVTDKAGLVLRISPNGRKTWRINKSIKGKRFVKQIGEYPEMTISEARTILAELTNVKEQHRSDTFEDLYHEWLALKKKSIKNWMDIDERMCKYILPKVGNMPLRIIKPPMIIRILKNELESRNKLETIKRICGNIKEIERFAVNYGYTEVLRFQGINEVFASPGTRLVNRPSVHPSRLPEILPKLWLSAVKAPTTWDALMIGFYTLLRPAEYCALEWSWIDTEKQIITVPAEVMKMKRPHIVPISSQLVQLLEHRPKFSEYVLPSPEDYSKHIKTEGQSLFLRRHGMKGVLVPHGIRSIGRTWMAEERIDHDIAEMCLAHRIGTSVELAYNRTDFLELRREAMQKWCDYVEKCLRGEPN